MITVTVTKGAEPRTVFACRGLVGLRGLPFLAGGTNGVRHGGSYPELEALPP